MTKKELKKLEYRKKLIQTMSLEMILLELVRRGLNPTVSSEDGIVKAA